MNPYASVDIVIILKAIHVHIFIDCVAVIFNVATQCYLILQNWREEEYSELKNTENEACSRDTHSLLNGLKEKAST